MKKQWIEYQFLVDICIGDNEDNTWKTAIVPLNYEKENITAKEADKRADKAINMLFGRSDIRNISPSGKIRNRVIEWDE